MTYHGLFTLSSFVEPGTLVALFRSSHLSVLYKSPIDGSLYILVSDSVFLREQSIVWERLEDVDGGLSTFVDGDFVRSTPVGGDWAGETAESTLRAFEAENGQLGDIDPAEYVPLKGLHSCRWLILCPSKPSARDAITARGRSACTTGI